MNCTEYERMYPVAMAGSLTPEQAQEFAAHRMNCSHCAGFSDTSAYLRMRLQTVAVEPEAPVVDWRSSNRASGNRSVSNGWALKSLSLAAGLVIGALVIGKLLPTIQTGSTASSIAANPVKKVVQPVEIAKNGIDTIKRNDSVNAKRNLQPIPPQFPGSMQVVGGN